jgi:peroxiredoxin
MTIKVGDQIPNASFTVMAADGPKTRSTDEIFGGKKVVLVGVAGAFTPVCGRQHIPGFIDKADTFRAKGIDTIAVTSVNDAFVMDAWAKSMGAGNKITCLADGNGDFAKALGLSVDLSGLGLGTRSQRYAMLVENGVVRKINLEKSPGELSVSSAEAFLNEL